MELRRDGDVHILTQTNGERGNGFTLEVLDELDEAFDAVEAERGNRALLIDSEDEKVWCNGIDLEWLRGQDGETIPRFITRLELFLQRLALLDVPTVASVGGHAFAGGALMALACDFRLMRADRGWFCLPEVDLKMVFTPYMYRIIRLLPGDAMRDLALSGRRIGGEEAERLRVVDAACPADELRERALGMARELAGKDRATYARIKRDLRAELADPPPPHGVGAV